VAEALNDKIEIEVNEGEAIFVPSGDWHFVRSHGAGTFVLFHDAATREANTLFVPFFQQELQ
jgi:quercetin dioxygenase-like cupin family protein